MLMDSMCNLIHYIPKRYKKGISEFIELLSPDMEERTYEIDGQHVYAKVMAYDTKESNACRLEAHNRYIDIQASLVGAEGIAIFNRKILRIEQDYREEEDSIFFYTDDHMPYAVNQNIPGMFSMIFPHEAHMPQLRADGYANHVKKLVIKMEGEYGRSVMR